MRKNHITEMVGLEGFEVVDSNYDETAEVPTATLTLEAKNQEGAWIQTIRKTLFKLGARIETSVRRFWIHASEDWPYQDVFVEVARSVSPAPG